jgi:hypothetical protein
VEDDDTATFAISEHEQGAGNPSVYVNAPLVLSFTKRALVPNQKEVPELPMTGSCALYTGGVEFRLGFGDYAGHTLTLVVWHCVMHVTESGDLPPASGHSRRPRSRERRRANNTTS